MVTVDNQALPRNPGTSEKPPAGESPGLTLCQPADAYRRSCPCRDVLDLVADKWTALVISALLPGAMRFGQLKRRLDGISQKVLTQVLRALERDGLLTRTIRPMPLEVHYALTDLGRDVAVPLDALRMWSERNVEAMLRARAAYDARAAGGEDAEVSTA